MVDIAMALDEFGGLVCTLTDGKVSGSARASNANDAAEDLLAALDEVSAIGVGECFWPRESGMYRWLIRREGSEARLVVLWSSGTMTGWENVLWTDCEWPLLEAALRDQIGLYQMACRA